MSPPDVPYGAPGSVPDPGAEDGIDFAARPYLLTGGRTRGRQPIAVETIVVRTQVSPRAAHPQSFEHGRVLEVLGAPLSVAEIAARLHLPLTVVLVLVGDLVADGLLVASEPSSGYRNDVSFIERLISGVAAL